MIPDKFKLEIDLGNDAFQGKGGLAEIARLLEDAAARVRKNAELGKLVDSNGNTCGEFKIVFDNDD